METSDWWMDYASKTFNHRRITGALALAALFSNRDLVKVSPDEEGIHFSVCVIHFWPYQITMKDEKKVHFGTRELNCHMTTFTLKA